MSTAPLPDPWAEWKTGYRDGLAASVTVAQVCAAEPDATAADVLLLLETLAESPVVGGNDHAVITVHLLHPPDLSGEPPANT